MKYHIQSFHPKVATTMMLSPTKPPKQSIKDQLLCSSKERYEKESEKYIKLTDLTVDIIVKTHQPLLIV